MPKVIFYDIEGFPVQIGTIVAYTEGWVQTHPELDIEDKIYQIVTIVDTPEEAGILGILEITDISGEWVDWHPNYTIPVEWVSMYQKLQAI